MLHVNNLTSGRQPRLQFICVTKWQEPKIDPTSTHVLRNSNLRCPASNNNYQNRCKELILLSILYLGMYASGGRFTRALFFARLMHVNITYTGKMLIDGQV